MNPNEIMVELTKRGFVANSTMNCTHMTGPQGEEIVFVFKSLGAETGYIFTPALIEPNEAELDIAAPIHDEESIDFALGLIL